MNYVNYYYFILYLILLLLYLKLLFHLLSELPSKSKAFPMIGKAGGPGRLSASLSICCLERRK